MWVTHLRTCAFLVLNDVLHGLSVEENVLFMTWFPSDSVLCPMRCKAIECAYPRDQHVHYSPLLYSHTCPLVNAWGGTGRLPQFFGENRSSKAKQLEMSSLSSPTHTGMNARTLTHTHTHTHTYKYTWMQDYTQTHTNKHTHTHTHAYKSNGQVLMWIQFQFILLVSWL